MFKNLLLQAQKSSLTYLRSQNFSVAKLVKQLREETGSPMLQCKKALEENNNDVEAAKEYLKKKGLSSAGKYSAKETREGVVGIRISDDAQRVGIMELNCQTDFVARTEAFLKYSDVFLKTLISSPELEGKTISTENAEEIKEFLEQNILNEQVLPQAEQSAKIAEVQQYLIAHLQENVNFRRFGHLQAESGLFGAYVHNTLASGIGLKSCLIELNLENQSASSSEKVKELANNIALQILGNRPAYLTRSEIPEEIVQKETEGVRASFGKKLEGKPEKVQAKMIEGKMKKFYEDQVLYNQAFIFDEDDSGKTIEQYINEVGKEAGTKISIKNCLLWSMNE